MQATQAEKNTFGEDVKLHPVTLKPLEQGIGSLPDDQQALFHLQAIELEQGEATADAMRKTMGIETRADREAAAKKAAQDAAKKADEVSALHARIAELETEVAELTKAK